MTARAGKRAAALSWPADPPSPFARASLREQQRGVTRERILDAAIAEFRRVGFERASISEIARMAGVSRPSIYAHFPSLDHVLFELGWRFALQIVRRLGPETQLAGVLDRLADAVIEVETSVGDAPLFRELISIFSRRSGIPAFDASEIPLLTELLKRFEDARISGELRPGMPPEQAARLCLSGVLGHLVGVDATPQDRRSDFRALFSLYLAEVPRGTAATTRRGAGAARSRSR
jgi:TetR/AcrR family transcriptional regulator, repressor for uid operon